MSSYASTQVGDYLKARFDFEFTGEKIVERLEDHIWEAGRRAQQQRGEVARVGSALAEDIAYVLRSIGKPAAPYEPNQRGDFAAGVRQCVALEREVQELVGVHQATLWALREHLSALPRVEDHTHVIGELRAARAHLEQAQHQVTELLAAREEWATDETELLRRLDEAEKQVKDYRAQLAGMHGRAAALEENLADAQRERDSARRAENDARETLALSEEKVQTYRKEIERLEDKADQLAADLAKANDPGEIGRT